MSRVLVLRSIGRTYSFQKLDRPVKNRIYCLSLVRCENVRMDSGELPLLLQVRFICKCVNCSKWKMKFQFLFPLKFGYSHFLVLWHL